jgi:hypothetical protein
MSHNFNEIFRDASGLRKFVPRLLTTNQKHQHLPLQKSPQKKKERMRMKFFLKMSPPAMRCGFAVMMFKPNNNPHNGRVLLSLAPPKKHDKCTQM